MINIVIAKTKKLKASPLYSESAFASFDYDLDLVAYFKALPTRAYHSETKQWEFPLSTLPRVCNELMSHDIEICAPEPVSSLGRVELPEGFKFKTEPYTHQLEGVLYGLQAGSFLLGDDQGLGKTKQIIDLAVALKLKEGMKHCLIICGVNGNKYNWEQEVATHSDESSWILGTRYTKRHPVKKIEGTSQDKLDDLMNLPDAFFIITNIETLRGLSHKNVKASGKGKRRKTCYPIAEQIQKLCESGEIGMIAFDEAHKAKNPTSQQGQALLSIQPKYAIPMSGTFLMNNPMDLYLPLKWAGYEDHSYYTYQQYYCRFGGFGGVELLGYKNLDKIQEVMQSASLRRTKSEVLDLPPKVHVVEYVDMYKEQAKVYNEVKDLILQEVDKIRLSPNPLTQLIRLRQVTGYPGIVSSKITKSAKLDRMCELVENFTSRDEKVIIFSQWEQITFEIQSRLKAYKPAYITGATKSENRQAEMDSFQTDPNCKVIIGTIGAMGTGFTLNAASNVIFVDEPWNRALKDQAEDRAHRIGTTGPVTVTTLICKDTIDERIYDLVQKKGRLSDAIIDSKFGIINPAMFVDYLIS